MTLHHHPEPFECPKCHALQTTATGAVDKAPEVGDILVCNDCRQIAQVGSAGPVAITFKEAETLFADDPAGLEELHALVHGPQRRYRRPAGDDLKAGRREPQHDGGSAGLKARLMDDDYE